MNVPTRSCGQLVLRVVVIISSKNDKKWLYDGNESYDILIAMYGIISKNVALII